MSGIQPEIYPNSNWGTRYEDGSAKGTGWLGGIRMPVEYGQFIPSYMTELGASDDNMMYPLITPNLTPMEINYLRMGNEPTGNIWDKAFEHAQKMKKEGKDTFK